MEDKEQFQELLKKAIGDRTQNEFSALTGIAISQLSRLVRGKNAYLPKPETLEKIAKASDKRVSFEDLMTACGHEMEEYEERKKNTPDHETARSEIREYKREFDELSGNKFDSFDDLFDFLSMMHMGPNSQISAGKEKKCKKVLDPDAENYTILTIKTTLVEHEASLFLIITYSHTVGGAIILSKCFTDGKTFLEKTGLEGKVDEYFGGIEQEFIKELREVFALVPLSKLSERAKNRLREGIGKLVGEKQERYIGVVKGIGFTINEFIDEKALRDFLRKHKVSLSIPLQKDIDEYLAGDFALPDGSKAVCNVTGDSGWGAFISNIMSKELNTPVGFWTQEGEEFLFNHNPDCIMISEDDLIEKGINWAMNVVEPYARELGIRVIGTQYFQAVFDKDAGMYKYLD